MFPKTELIPIDFLAGFLKLKLFVKQAQGQVTLQFQVPEEKAIVRMDTNASAFELSIAAR